MKHAIGKADFVDGTSDTVCTSVLSRNQRADTSILGAIVAASALADRKAARRHLADAASQMGKLALNDVDLSNRDLSQLDLRGASCNRAGLFGANLSGSDLTGASLICAGTERANFSGARLVRAYIHGFAAQVCNFEKADLSDIADATGSLFHGCSMVGVQLCRSSFSGSTFYQCDFTDADLTGADLQGVTFTECTFRNTVMDNIQLDQGRIQRCLIDGLSLAGARGDHVSLLQIASARGLTLKAANFPGLSVQSVSLDGLDGPDLAAEGSLWQDCRLTEVNLRNAQLKQSIWQSGTLRDVRLNGAVLVRGAFRDIRFDRLDASDAKLENAHFVDTALDGAILNGIKGRTMVMRDCSLRGAALHNAYLYRASFTGDVPTRMCLREADLQGAVLVQSYLAADFTGANLRDANLTYARINQSKFIEADLSDVALYQASMVKTDVTGARVTRLKWPFFADRVAGLADAVDGIESESDRNRLHQLLARFKTAISGEDNGST